MIKWMNFGLFLFIVAMPLMSYSCSSSDDNTQEIEMTISKESVILTQGSQSSTIAIKSNSSWSVTSSENWCALTPSSGNAGTTTINISVTENTNTEDRTSKLTFSSGGESKSITLKQTLKQQLSIDQNSAEVAYTGDNIAIKLSKTNDYTITYDCDWITPNTAKSLSTDELSFTVSRNLQFAARTGNITFTSGSLSQKFTVNQKAAEAIPSDPTGVESNAILLVKKINIGWNLGNSLEVPDNETGWGNPKTTKALIDAVKNAGFNAVRIPCAWDSYADQTTYEISAAWLARVKEVVDYCIDNGMYTIINIHWDGGWLEEHPLYSYQEAVNKKQKAYWEQIATYFRDYDEHLLFAGTNEVHANYNEPTTEHNTVQMSFNQAFVDAVRSTGGKNAYRNLIIQSYNTNIEWAVKYLKMPTDVVANRLILETHYYNPWDFCGQKSSESGVKFHWGKEGGYTGVSSYGQEDNVRTQFASLKTNFVDKGIPVIMGEYGAVNRTSALSTDAEKQKHQESRAYFLKYVTQKMKEYGIAPFYWDNGPTANDGFGIFNRSNLTVSDQKALDALKQGAEAGSYPY